MDLLAALGSKAVNLTMQEIGEKGTPGTVSTGKREDLDGQDINGHCRAELKCAKKEREISTARSTFSGHSQEVIQKLSLYTLEKMLQTSIYVSYYIAQGTISNLLG